MPPVVVEREVVYVERQRRRAWPWVLGVLGALVLCCCGAGGFVINHLGGQYPAQVHVTNEVAGLTKTKNGAYQLAAAAVQAQIRSQPGVEGSEVAVLEDAAHPAQGVIFLSATRLIWDPKAELDNSIRLMDTDLRNPTTFDPGPMGGYLKCADSTDSNDNKPVVVCAWIDHGSLGIGIFYGNRPMPECAKKLLDIRAAVLKRG